MNSEEPSSRPIPPRNQKQNAMISFRAPREILAVLEQAEKATGADKTELILEAIRTELPAIVRRKIKEREIAATAFFSEHSPSNGGSFAVNEGAPEPVPSVKTKKKTNKGKS